jgi:nitronate monooxygenase
MSTSGSTDAPAGAFSGGFSEPELGEFLNRMLEAERAGAKALVVFLDAFSRNSKEWKILRQVQAEEAHNCALIGKMLERSGRPYSHATGEFFDKAVAVGGRRARLEFLVRGLRWAVRKFDQALPRVGNPEMRVTIGGMRDTHARSIEACAAVIRDLKD